jgi:alanine racemase
VSRLRWIEIDLKAVAHNVRAVRALVGPRVGLSAVVKADAYGHGAVPVARAALAAGADHLAVTYLDEALELRRTRLSAPILVMGPVLPEEAPLAVRHRLAVMVDNRPLLKALAKAAGPKRPVPVQVKVNLGLFRWGIPLKDVVPFLREVKKLRSVQLTGVFAHPGYMVGKNTSRVEESLEDFLAVVRPALAEHAPAPEIHVADSAVLLDMPRYRLSRVRVGNLIYGINPTKQPLPLKNPWKVCTRLVHVENLSVGQAVGYGGEFVATRPMRVGTLPVGYAHGLTLEPASRWIQLVSGQTYWGMWKNVKCPFVGRVGMSHSLVDLTEAPQAKVGDTIHLPLRRTASANWEKVYNKFTVL